MFRPVESHVRILSHSDAFTVTPNHNCLRLTNKANGSTSSNYNVTRVHRGVATHDFFSDVILPCIQNTLSGQSHTVLFCGPRSSGRSNTLYGTRDVEKGVVELTAEAYLRIAKERDTTTVTHSHFLVHRDSITDCSPDLVSPTSPNDNEEEGAQTIHSYFGEPVPVIDFSSPVGVLPLPHMMALDNSKDAVVSVTQRDPGSSLFTQFHVYTSVEKGSARRTFAILTFVDVTAFHKVNHQPSDLSFLQQAVHSLTTGADPSHSILASRLTQVLQNSMTGSATLLCVATVTGNPELNEETNATLEFAQTISRIQQVLVIVHLNTPKWVFDVEAHCHQLKAMRQELFMNHYALGVMDCFFSAKKVLDECSRKPEDMLDAILREAAAARAQLGDSITKQAEKLKASIAAALQIAGVAQADVSTVSTANNRLRGELQRVDSAIAELEDRVESIRQEAEDTINSYVSQVQALQAESESKRAVASQYNEMRVQATQEAEDLWLVNNMLTSNLMRNRQEFAAMTIRSELKRKKRALDEKLAAVSRRAEEETDAQRAKKKRRVVIARIVAAEDRLASLRAKSQQPTPLEQSISPAPITMRSSSHPSSSAVPITSRHFVDLSINSDSNGDGRPTTKTHVGYSASSKPPPASSLAVKMAAAKSVTPLRKKRCRSDNEPS